MDGQVLDYTVKAHKAIYDESVKSLYATATERFNLVATTMQVLLTLLALRFARISNAAFNALGGPITSLHGQFTLDQMRARVWWVGTPTRIYQDDDALAGCLWNSLSDAATAIMALRHEDYTINGFVSGILLLKCILLSSMVEAVQDHGLLRRRMTQALAMFRSLKHNVKAFNLWCKDLIRQLAQQGGTFPDFKVFIEEAYLDSPEEQFVRFIQHLQDQDRMNPPGRSTQQLMDLAEGKVNQMQVLAEHKATDPGKEPELMALKAELESLRKVVNKFKKDKSGYESSDSNGSRKQGKGRKDNSNKKRFPDELKGAPKPDDPSKPRIIDGVKYWWCEVRKKWGKHSPDECTLKDKKKSTNSDTNGGSNSDKSTDSGSDRNGKLVEANMAILEAGR
jgi:hypothetical protein